MIDHMARRGADVLYGSMNPPVHVSGHASMEEMKLVLNLVRPRYFMPIHGEFRQLTKHARLAEHLRASGLENTFIMESGDVLEIDHHGGRAAIGRSEPDRNNSPLLLGELREGRLRQGWGYDPSQDLRLIQEEIARGGNWQERLSNVPREVLPYLRMLSSSEDSVQLGDWILVPNLPEAGSFLVADVVGPYYYARLPLPRDNDINGLGNDYGHVLPIHLTTEKGVNKYSEIVDAPIRGTLRTPMRMWNIDSHGDAIGRLVDQYKAGGDFSTAKSDKARFHTAWEIARSHAEEQFRERLGPELDTRFQAAEWEEPISLVLRKLYPGADVRRVGGPREEGADVIVQLPNYFGACPG